MTFTSTGLSDGSGPGGSAPTISGRTILASERFMDLCYREKFYLCTQHDDKVFDFDGRIINKGGRAAPMMLGEATSTYVPLRQRRPSSPYRLGKIIVNRFTSMLFGSQRWPAIRVEGDSDTQDFCEALIEATGLPAKMIEARNIGGSVGTVGLSWIFRNGKPIVTAHNGKYLHVSEWEDRERFIPAAVSEVYQYPKTEWDPSKKRYVRNIYWYRRDWTKTEDIGYEPVLFESGQDPVWTMDPETSSEHSDGFCHFVWIQNIPTDEEDGMPDYDGLYDTFDSLDLLLSVAVRGMTLNLDPTLVLKLDPDIVSRMGVKKGSDNALIVGLEGGADYLELGGQSIDVATKLFNLIRKCALEVSECVLTDPDQIAAGQTSSVSILKIYEPMVAKCDVLREQYGAAIKRLLQQMVLSTRMHMGEVGPVQGGDGETVNDDGETVSSVPYLDLPQKVTSSPINDEDEQPTGEISIEMTPRQVGKGGVVNLAWGPYFALAPQDQAALITALSVAVGAQPFMSKQTASEIITIAFGRNPAEEFKRLGDDTKASQALEDKKNQLQAQAFGSDPAGKVDNEDEPPFGAKPKASGGDDSDDSSPPFGKD